MFRFLIWLFVATGALPVILAIIGLCVQLANNPVMHDGRLSLFDKIRIAAIDGGLKVGATPVYLRYGMTFVGVVGVLFIVVFVYYTFYVSPYEE